MAALLGAAGCATAVDSGNTSTSGSGGTGGDTGTGATGGGHTTASSSGTGMGPCVYATDCPPTDDPCTAPTCINGECKAQPANDGSACDDGNWCTDDDTCQDGVCVAGATRYCPPPDTCHIGVCDPVNKNCGAAPGNDGAQCDDGDPCTGWGSCSNGTCGKGQAIDCSFLDGVCSDGVCDPQLGCVQQPKNDGAACDDGQFCTINDTCQNGVCTGGAPNNCAQGNPCFTGVCIEATKSCTATPANDGAPCDDGNACTDNTTCLGGTCVGGNAVNEGQACDDGSGCTTNTICQSGVCGGGQGPTVYFADDFHDNSKGWTLGPEWAIGPTAPSPPGTFGSDPDFDHTATADNGVAGVVLGGNASTSLHDYEYLTSPAFNTANAQGQVIFGYYRWLNSDYHPYMYDTIDVYDGATWHNIWINDPNDFGDSINDTSWTYFSFDITAYKNAAMQIRFGLKVDSSGAYTVGSWNVDDVLVASGACP